ncbi:MAG: GNAT family N-acetyltransferase [Paracoccus sp. (in: a-proteobacteria)]|uniref:GNAT family N-acetyltransferase n=1 Tax=Paracoccus sp. TaxID=267 RepID=UPI0039E4C6E2
MSLSWTIRAGIPPELAPQAARLYWHCFGPELQPWPLSRHLGAALIRALMQPRRALAAIAPSGRLIGLAGLRGTEGGFLALRPQAFREVLGPWRGRLGHGATELLMLEGRASPDLILDGVAVAASWRQRGVARSLIAQAEVQARDLGHPALRVEVRAANGAALHAWTAMGFRAAYRERMGWPWLSPAHVMRREVRPGD